MTQSTTINLKEVSQTIEEHPELQTDKGIVPQGCFPPVVHEEIEISGLPPWGFAKIPFKQKLKDWFTKKVGPDGESAIYNTHTELDWEHVGYASGATLAIIGLVWFIIYKCKHKK